MKHNFMAIVYAVSFVAILKEHAVVKHDEILTNNGYHSGGRRAVVFTQGDVFEQCASLSALDPTQYKQLKSNANYHSQIFITSSQTCMSTKVLWHQKKDPSMKV